MKHKYHKKPGTDPEVAHVRKERLCLMCGVKFESQWSGDRVCPKCKNGTAWRQGGAWDSSRRSA